MDKKQLENVKLVKYLGSMINRGRCTRDIKSRFGMATVEFNNNKKTLFNRKLYLDIRNKLGKCYIWSIALYGAESWPLREVEQKYMENF